MSVELLKHCLSYEFYEKNRDLIEDDFFDSDQLKLYTCLKEHFAEHESDVLPSELYTLFKARYPAQTSASIQAVASVVDHLREVESSPDVAESLIKMEKIKLLSTTLAQEAFHLADGKHRDIEKIDLLIRDIQTTFADTSGYDFEPITDDLDELLELGKMPCQWKFHLEPFKEQAEGIGPGTLSLIGARPNAGKTLFITSLIFQPGGWASQGAKILYRGNEESAARTKLRGVSSYTGMDMREVHSDTPEMEKAKELYAEIAKNVTVIDVVGMSFAKLEELIHKHKPDIVVIDQLDKVKVSGKFNGKHEEYGAIYVTAREIAKKHKCAVVGVSQASADADGKLYYSYDLLAGSKTDKAAECDLIITIGKEGYGKTQGNDNGLRVANFCKNKLTGNEGHVAFTIQPEISRIDL
jgi:replicative DNA helicase